MPPTEPAAPTELAELAELAEPMPPACLAASTPPAGGRRDPSERQIIAEAARLAQRAHHSWGLALPPQPRGAVQSQPVQTLHQLRATADRALAELRRRTGPVDPEIRDDLLRALDLELHLSRHILTRRSARRAALRRGLERLRPVADPAHLLDRACVEALRSCGVRRAMLSRVSDGVWSPWRSAGTVISGGTAVSAGTASGTGTAAAWHELGPMPIERLPLEAEVVAERRPALVERPVSDPRVHPVLRRLLTSSFVVAPIAPADTVIGLLHLDRSGEAREVDRDDLEVAWAFAEGFGRVYERAVHRQRLDAQRRLVQRAAQRQDLDTAPLDHAIDILPTVPRARALRTRHRQPAGGRPRGVTGHPHEPRTRGRRPDVRRPAQRTDRRTPRHLTRDRQKPYPRHSAQTRGRKPLPRHRHPPAPYTQPGMTSAREPPRVSRQHHRNALRGTAEQVITRFVVGVGRLPGCWVSQR